jgi:hypothetical protein
VADVSWTQAKIRFPGRCRWFARRVMLKDRFTMNKRTATLWFPALFSLLAAMGSLFILRQVGLRPYLLWVGRMPVLLYVPWLTFLPLAGTVGAYLSRRGGGRFFDRLTAALFPALALFGLVGMGLTWMAVANQLDRPQWLYVVLGFFNWAALPSVGLVLGAIPFLSGPRQQT